MITEKENKELVTLVAAKEDNWVGKDEQEGNFTFTLYPIISFYNFIACECSNYSKNYKN